MAKTILFKLTLQGHGVVNFDSNDQKWYHNQQDGVSLVRHDNVSFAKGRYYRKPHTDKLLKKIVISAECLRHNMYINEMPNYSTNIMHHRPSLLNFLASKAAVERGYMFATKAATLKRKSPVNITEAEQFGLAKSSIETNSNSGVKTSKTDEDAAGDTSFYAREMVGDITYEALGSIDIDELQYISLSPNYDRLAVDPDMAAEYLDTLSADLGSRVPEPAYYRKSKSLTTVPEYGILLTDDQTKGLVSDILTRLMSINIAKSQTGHAYTRRLDIKIVENPLVDTFHSRNWTRIYDSDSGPAEIPEYSITPGYVFVEAADAIEEVNAQNAAVQAYNENSVAAKKADKAAKAAKKADKAKAQDEGAKNE